MLKHFLNFWVGGIPEVVSVEAAISSLLTTFPAYKVNSPSLVHVASKFRVSNDQFTHVLSTVAVLPQEFLAFVFSLSEGIIYE